MCTYVCTYTSIHVVTPINCCARTHTHIPIQTYACTHTSTSMYSLLNNSIDRLTLERIKELSFSCMCVCVWERERERECVCVCYRLVDHSIHHHHDTWSPNHQSIKSIMDQSPSTTFNANVEGKKKGSREGGPIYHEQVFSLSLSLSSHTFYYPPSFSSLPQE